MGNHPGVRASDIQFDGAFRKIPGFSLGAFNGDRWPHFIQSGLVTLTGTTPVSPGIIAPFDYSVVGLLFRTVGAQTGATPISIGNDATPNKFINNGSLAAAAAGSVIDLSGNLSGVAGALNGNAGDQFVFTPNGGTGSGQFVLVYTPRI